MLSLVRVALIQSARILSGIKRLNLAQRKRNSSCLTALSWDMGLFLPSDSVYNIGSSWVLNLWFWSGVYPIGSSGPQALDSDWNYTSTIRVSSLLTADLGTSQPLQLLEPIPCNKSLSINTYILLALPVWKTLTHTYLC